MQTETNAPNYRWMVALLLTLLLTALQVWRIVAFIDVYGGLEHDGGWIISIARSLAEHGEYTTLVSTIPDPNVAGTVNVDGKFDIQAEDGRIWFFTGNGIGPTSILPNAVVLSVLGYDFWALRTGPLIFYALFLLLAAYLVYQIAGVWAILLLHGYLWAYPHISIFLGYEAMGEVPAMMYILLAYVVCGWAILTPTRRGWAFFWAGLAAGLALNAKIITLWSVSGIFAWMGLLWLLSLMPQRTENLFPTIPRPTFLHLIYAGAGAGVLFVVWEAIQAAILISLSNVEMYWRHLEQRYFFIIRDGSGLDTPVYSGPEFFWDKFFLLGEVAHPDRWVTGLIIGLVFLSGPLLLWLWRGQPRLQTYAFLMWFGWLVNTTWFVTLAKTGWPRHYWFGLVLAILLLSSITVTLIQRGIAQRQYGWLVAGVASLGLVGWGFAAQTHVWQVFLDEQIVARWQDKQVNTPYDASLPWIIIPRQAQQDIIDYIQAMPPDAHVFYPASHKNAEIAPQVDRLLYPLQRRLYISPHPDDVVLVGPSLISPWKSNAALRRDVLALVEVYCPDPIIRNDYYILCPIAPIDDNVLQTGVNMEDLLGQ